MLRLVLLCAAGAAYAAQHSHSPREHARARLRDALADVASAVRRDGAGLRAALAARRRAVDALLEERTTDGLAAVLDAVAELPDVADDESPVFGDYDVSILHGPPAAPATYGERTVLNRDELHYAMATLRQPHARMLRAGGGGGSVGKHFRLHLPHDTLHAMSSADSVPLYGVVRNGTIYADPLNLPARCRPLTPSAAEEEAVVDAGSGVPGVRVPPPSLRCDYGAGSVDVGSLDEMLQRARDRLADAQAAKLAAHAPPGVPGQARKQRRQRAPAADGAGHHARLRRLAEDGSMDRLWAWDRAAHAVAPLAHVLGLGGSSSRGASSGGRLLYTPTSQTTGVRTMLALRTRWIDSTDGAAVSASSVNATMINSARIWAQESFGIMTAAVANNAQCVYAMQTIAAANSSDAGLMYDQATAAARAHPDPACRFEPNNFNHVLVVHQGAQVGYGGLGACPGSVTWYNGFLDSWIVLHEVGHNLGLPHGFTWDIAARTQMEYADATEPMGSARETWAGLGYQSGFKDGMNWVGSAYQWDVAPTGAVQSVRLYVAAAERANLSSAAAAAAPVPVVVTTRIPTNDNLPNAWVYSTWRASYNRAKLSGLQLHHVPLDNNPFANPVGGTGNQLGPPTLLDTVPSTLDQLDGEVVPGSAFVYGGGGAPRTMVEVDAAAVRLPAGSTDVNDDVLPVRLTSLTAANERPEGRGCVPGATACQPTAASATVPAVCNGNTTAVLTQVAPVGVFRLALPPDAGASELAVRAHTCGSLPAGTQLGVFTDYPAAQALARGAAVGSGAYTFSEVRYVTAGGGWTGALSTQACGEVSFPLTAGAPVYLVAALTPAAYAASALASSPTATLTLTLTTECAPAVRNMRAFLRHDTTLLGGDWQGVFQHFTSSGATGVVASRRQFMRPASPWFSINRIQFDSGINEWRWCWASYRGYDSCNAMRNEPAPAGTFEVVNITSLDGTAVAMRYACPPDMYAPSDGAATCAACPTGAVSVAGAVGAGACVCGRGWGYSSASGACSPCPANTYKATEADAACTPCPTGATSPPGSINSMACTTVWCDRVDIAGHSDGRCNGAFLKTGMYNGLPYYKRSGAATILYKNGWSGAWSFTDDTATWPTYSYYFGGAYDMKSTVNDVPPQYWKTADWGSALAAGRTVTTACACPTGTTFVNATGACVTSTTPPAGAATCVDNSAWSGSACVPCPPYQVANAAGTACVCPVGYTAPGAVYVCEPPRVLNVTAAAGSAAALAAAFTGTYALVGTVAAPALRPNASAPMVPTYVRVAAAAGTDGSSGTTVVHPYLVGHPDRGEWSFKPDLSPAHSPRYAFTGDYAGGVKAHAAGFAPPLAPSVSGLTDPAAAAAVNNAGYAVPVRVFDGGALYFSASLSLVLQPADLATPSATPSPTPSQASLTSTPSPTPSLSASGTGTISSSRSGSGTPTASPSCASGQCACSPVTCDFRIREGAGTGGYWAWDAASDTIKLAASASSATSLRVVPGLVCGGSASDLTAYNRLVVVSTGKAVNHASYNLHANAWAYDACPTSVWLDVAWRLVPVPSVTAWAVQVFNPYNGGTYATVVNGLVAITDVPDASRLWYVEYISSGPTTMTPSITASRSATPTNSPSPTCAGPTCGCGLYTCAFRLKDTVTTGAGSYWAHDVTADTFSLQAAAAAATTFRLLAGIVCGTNTTTYDRLVAASTTGMAVNHASMALHAGTWAPDACPSVWYDVAWRFVPVPGGPASAYRLFNAWSGGTYASVSGGLLAITSPPDATRVWYVEWVGSPTPSATASPTGSRSSTATPSLTPSRTGSVTASLTDSRTPTGTGTPSVSRSGTGSLTGTGTRSPTGTGSNSPTTTASRTAAPTTSASLTSTSTPTPTSSSTTTATPSPTSTPSQTRTGSPSTTGTSTLSGTGSVSASGTGTPSRSGTASRSALPTTSGTKSALRTTSPTRSGSGTSSLTATRSRSRTRTRSASRSRSRTGSRKAKLV